MSDASHSGKLVLTDWWAWMQRVNKEWDAEFYERFVAKRLDSAYPEHNPNSHSYVPSATNSKLANF